MLKALELASGGAGYVEPNPMVGALILRGNEVIGEGFHCRFGVAHAEANAIRNAKDAGHDVKGATLYVTLEPCAHRGKTPPCCEAIIEAGLQKVVIAAEDPLWKQHAGGENKRQRGIDVLRGAGLEVETGLCRDSAVMLNAAFYKRAATNMPLLVAKWAMSADGKIATGTGSSKWISCPQSRRIVHEMRGKVDAIIVGSRTANRDDPRLTCREAEVRRTAKRIVLCGVTPLSLDSNLVRTASEAPVMVAFPETSPPPNLTDITRAGCEPMPLSCIEISGRPRLDPAALLHVLAKREASNVLVEGGGSTLGCFFDMGLVDRAMIFIAPFIIGGKEAVTPVAGEGVESIKFAHPFKGRFGRTENQTIGDKPRIGVETVGKDIMFSGWLSDPREWYDQVVL